MRLPLAGERGAGWRVAAVLPAPAGPVELLETLCPEWKKDPDTLAARNDSSFSFPCHSVTLSAKCQMASLSRRRANLACDTVARDASDRSNCEALLSATPAAHIMQHTKQTCNTANMRCNWYQLDLRLERCARASVPLWATVLAGTLRHHAACSASDRCYRRSLPAWYGPVHANARTHARTLFHTHAHARAHIQRRAGGRCHDTWSWIYPQ